MKAGIVSVGWWVPKARIYAKEIATQYGLAEDVVNKIGLKSRPIAAQDEHPSTMGARAALNALKAANLQIDDLDLLIFAGVSRDWPTPWVAAFGVLHEMGATRTAGMDISTRCAGSIDAIWLAKTLIESGTYKTIAICCAERFDYLFGVDGEPAQQPFDAMYSAGAACMIISAEQSANQILAFSNFTNPDLSIHNTMGPVAGGSRVPLTAAAVEKKLHLWQSQLSMREITEIANYSANADRFNYPELFRKTGFNGADFVICSPLDPVPQIAVLKELGIAPADAFFTVPFLGHIGPADLLLILGVAIASGKTLGERIIFSTRTPVYSNAVAIKSTKADAGIAVFGEGIDITLWANRVNQTSPV